MESKQPLEYLISAAMESAAAREQFVREHAESMIKAAEAVGHCIRSGGKILIMGNGGSAADSQHMAAELVGRLMKERRPLPAIALTTDTSNLTAIGNDYGYDQVFVRQIQALAKSDDVVIGISTSGNSKNVLDAMAAARKIGCRTIALTGGGGGRLKNECDIALNVAAGKNSARIQESHIFAVHMMVDLLDRYYL